MSVDTCKFLLVMLLHSNFGYFSLSLAHKFVSKSYSLREETDCQ
jgi:hypothetical protein